MMAGIDAGIVLSAKQCIEIGQEALHRSHYYLAIEWMETALNKVNSSADNTADLDEAVVELHHAKRRVSQGSY